MSLSDVSRVPSLIRLLLCLAAAGLAPRAVSAADHESSAGDAVPGRPSIVSLLQQAAQWTPLLEAVGKSSLSLDGLIRPEQLGIEVDVEAEASNNQIEAFNHNRVQILSGNSLRRKFSLFTDLNIHIHVSPAAPPHDAAPDEESAESSIDETAPELDDAALKKQRKQQLRRLKKEFQRMDADGDGQISWKEFRAATEHRADAEE